MNLELPFAVMDPGELDAWLARIDLELERLFLDEVDGELERLRAEGAASTAEAPA